MISDKMQNISSGLINKKGDKRSLPYCEVVCIVHEAYLFPYAGITRIRLYGYNLSLLGTPRSVGKDIKE
ncbi:hypothetical protein CLV62_12859 [Dysgonomonas alginatilytica]|uniref:Uncharacterized protein n=1 Tax=Dysgonomonas alginatilytica TaxID=1605892 RepID=A0A2V3PJS0_9BACT|nr:hypothetical protein CLV62_12859 [Dysgonomonas alginatilytica]